MHIVYWEPGNGSGYRVGVATLGDQPGSIVFCFGYGDHSMTTDTIDRRREPHSFEHFVKHWDSIRLAGNLIDLWARFMALRHVLGYPTDWEHLPDQTRSEATQMFAAGPWMSTPERELARSALDWQAQLQPLVAALAP